MGPERLQWFPGHAHPLRQRLRRPDPPGRLPTGDPQGRGQHPSHRPLTQRLRQVPRGAFLDHLVIDQRQPVPQPFEALQEPDQPGVVQGFQGPVLNQFDQMIKPDVQIIQGLLGYGWIPDIHDHMLLEQVFERNAIRQENKENLERFTAASRPASPPRPLGDRSGAGRGSCSRNQAINAARGGALVRSTSSSMRRNTLRLKPPRLRGRTRRKCRARMRRGDPNPSGPGVPHLLDRHIGNGRPADVGIGQPIHAVRRNAVGEPGAAGTELSGPTSTN